MCALNGNLGTGKYHVTNLNNSKISSEEIKTASLEILHIINTLFTAAYKISLFSLDKTNCF